MSQPDAETPLESDRDAEAWRFDLAFITPYETSEWLGVPVVLFLRGAGGIAALMWRQTIHPLTPQGWIAFGVACVFALWAFPLAYLARRAQLLYDIDVSQNYTKILYLSGTILIALLEVVFIESTQASGAEALGIVGLWGIVWRVQRPPHAHPFSAFRLALGNLVRRAVLIEIVVLSIISLAFMLFALLSPTLSAQLATYYVIGPIFIVVPGAALAIFVCRTHRRAKAG